MKRIQYLIIALAALLVLAGCENESDKLTATGNCPGCDLTNAYFKNAQLEGTDLSKAKLLGASFEGSVLKQANFDQAFLFNTNLMNSDLSGANFKDAVMITANLRNAKLDGADFTGANLSGAIWTQGFRCQEGSIGICYKTVLEKLEATGNCRDCKLFSKDLSNRTFENADFAKASFAKADLTGVKFINCDLKGANLKGAQIEGAEFTGSELMGATWVTGDECGDGSIGKCVPR